jgi:hypothetical protein
MLHILLLNRCVIIKHANICLNLFLEKKIFHEYVFKKFWPNFGNFEVAEFFSLPKWITRKNPAFRLSISIVVNIEKYLQNRMCMHKTVIILYIYLLKHVAQVKILTKHMSNTHGNVMQRRELYN